MEGLRQDLLDAPAAAKHLLGRFLIKSTAEGGAVGGRIVETEAYLGTDDPASHTFRGPTARNRAMYGPPGTAYVYLTYGIHYMFNIVTGPEGEGEAVLVRALEPLWGLDLMRQRRGREKPKELCSGPAKLVEALGIEPADNGHDLAEEPLQLLSSYEEAAYEPPEQIMSSPRVGISQGDELPLRYFVAGSRYVSKAPQNRQARVIE